MTILGIDPGSVVCGYGVITVSGSVLEVVEFGAVQVKRRAESFPERLCEIYERLTAVITRTNPVACAMELSSSLKMSAASSSSHRHAALPCLLVHRPA